MSSLFQYHQVGSACFAARDGQRWLVKPRKIITAHSIAEVLPGLQQVAQGVARGLYAAGFLAYEATPALDPALQTHASGPLPLLWFGLYDTMTEIQPPRLPKENSFSFGAWSPLITAEEYKQNIQRIHELIAAGEISEVNYTFPLEAAFHGVTWDCFVKLYQAQQADFCAYLNLEQYCLLSLSPELFFRLHNGRLETRPMKGTRPRGRWLKEDQDLARALAIDPKDRNENILTVDVLREDMSRVSLPGSVQVQSCCDVEAYPTVWQMTSTICSQTNANVPEIMQALFPSGSVTGAPKARALRVIRNLETTPRGVYCGTIGWWAPDGRAEFNVAIRTLTIDKHAGRARYNVGSGITLASSAEAEYQECLDKAAILTRSIEDFQLLESLRYEQGWFLLQEHLERMAASAAYFNFKYDRAVLEQALRDVAQTLPPDQAFKVRLLLSRDGRCQTEYSPLPSPRKLCVGFAREPVDITDRFLYHKTTCRRVYETARASRPDCDDVLLWNTRGEITESTIANVVLELDGKLWTPPLTTGLLGGVFREFLLRQGKIAERVLTREDVKRAQSIHLINSVREWIPANWVP